MCCRGSVFRNEEPVSPPRLRLVITPRKTPSLHYASRPRYTHACAARAHPRLSAGETSDVDPLVRSAHQGPHKANKSWAASGQLLLLAKQSKRNRRWAAKLPGRCDCCLLLNARSAAVVCSRPLHRSRRLAQLATWPGVRVGSHRRDEPGGIFYLCPLPRPFLRCVPATSPLECWCMEESLYSTHGKGLGWSDIPAYYPLKSSIFGDLSFKSWARTSVVLTFPHIIR